MRTIHHIVVLMLVSLVYTGNALATDLTVLGLSKVKLKGAQSLDFVVYDSNGVKSGSTLVKVKSREVAGLPVLDEAGGRLILIKLRGQRVWLRKDWFSLSSEPLPPCPKVRPGGSADQVVLGVAAVGPDCRHEPQEK